MKRQPWGAMSNPRGRLRRLRNRIDAEELAPVYPVSTPLDRRRRRHAATYLALAEQVAEGLGSDPKCTPRRLSHLHRMAESLLAKLKAPGPAAASSSIAAALRRVTGPA
jgi:hypothetical protein